MVFRREMNLNSTQIGAYYLLTKPTVVLGNLVTVCAGFLLARAGTPDVALLVTTLCGIGLLMASALVCNNYLDRDIDALMERTSRRVVAMLLISPKGALIFAGGLGAIGAVLLAFTNLLTLLVALFGHFAYTVLYSMWSKRGSVWGTAVGSISGSIPPVVGYAAAANVIDVSALYLFLILTFWQMAHAYAVALYRLGDYERARIPVFPLIHGTRLTMFLTLMFVGLFGYTSFILGDHASLGSTFVFGVVSIALLWFLFGLFSMKRTDDRVWGKHMLLGSVLAIILFSGLIVLERLTHIIGAP